MADDSKRQQKKLEKSRNSFTDEIRNQLQRLYKATFYTKSDAKEEIDNMEDRINSSMDKILTDVNYSTGLSSISSLYSKALTYQNDKEVVDGFDSLFMDGEIDGMVYQTMFNNRTLRLLDAEIDMICKYMPKLEEAIETKIDNVLSADHFTKDFITANNDNNSSNISQAEFYNNIKILKDKYELIELFQDVAYETSKYGEQFIYIVPYKVAIAKLLNNPNRNRIVKESVNIPNKNIKSTGKSSYDVGGNAEVRVNIEFNMSNTFNAEINDYYKACKRLSAINEQSMNIIYEEAKRKSADIKLDKALTPRDKLDATSFYDKDSDAQDGFINTNIVSTSKRAKNLKVNGCLVKRLSRYNIIPIYIDDLCLGYYYVENKNLAFNRDQEDFPVSDTTTPINALGINTGMDDQTVKNSAVLDDGILNNIAARISGMIDDKFINLNKDLTKEIYAILKQSMVEGENNFKVTFLPPDDVVHTYFKKDKRTHRGISDLAKALIPAKLYIGLYIANTLGAMSRGQDRRVYYVKNSGIDTNISQILLNTMNQIKMQNFNIRQIENMRNVLHIIGRFNDFVIPTGPNGDAPVQFEIMQGQNIDPQTELLQRLEEMAVNSTDVPIELVQSRQSIDYAIQASMSSSRFLKKVFGCQAIANRWFSKIMTMIYRAEFDNPKALISVNLPQPMFLNLTNTNQFINNINELCTSISEVYGANLAEEVKPIFLANVKKEYMKTYVDPGLIERIVTNTMIEVKSSEVPSGGEDDGTEGGLFAPD